MRRHGWAGLGALALITGGTALAQTAAAPITVGAPPTPITVPADPSMTLTITAPTEVQIDVAGGMERDAQILIRRDGSWVADDSDTGPGTDARLNTFLAPGTYDVIVWEYQHRQMQATVTAITPPAFTPVATIAPGAPPTPVTSPESDWARGASVEVSLAVATGGNYRLEASTAAAQCSPEITVIRDSAVVERISAPSSGQPATRDVQLSPGNYTLRIRDWWNHACTMSLTVNPA